MSNNYGRNNLVIRFKCSKCGNQLNLSYEKDETATRSGQEDSDGISGGFKVEGHFYIEPCKTCIEEPQHQLDTLRKILKGASK